MNTDVEKAHYNQARFPQPGSRLEDVTANFEDLRDYDETPAVQPKSLPCNRPSTLSYSWNRHEFPETAEEPKEPKETKETKEPKETFIVSRVLQQICIMPNPSTKTKPSNKKRKQSAERK